MSSRGLSKEEIKKRLIRLRNLDYLHEVQRFKIWHLRDENRELRKEIKALKLLASEQQKTIDDLKLQIEELRTIVFGRKKQKGESDDDDLLPPKEKNQRTSDSHLQLLSRGAFQERNRSILRRRHTDPDQKDRSKTSCRKRILPKMPEMGNRHPLAASQRDAWAECPKIRLLPFCNVSLIILANQASLARFVQLRPLGRRNRQNTLSASHQIPARVRTAQRENQRRVGHPS